MDACFCYCNIVCAIGFIQSHGLVSRDIKPANFLVGHDGYFIMTDLGISERKGGGGSWLDMGTTQYMAPELIQQGYPVGRGVDWWASGVMLYEMLTRMMVCHVLPPAYSSHARYRCDRRGCLIRFAFLCLAVPGRQ